jgi:hypothetical protein
MRFHLEAQTAQGHQHSRADVIAEGDGSPEMLPIHLE